jgi:type VII secretion system (Wss) protein YukD
MAVLLVTVLGSAGALDLTVPAETPIGELLAPLTRLHGDAGKAPGDQATAVSVHRWSLAPIHGDPLPHDRSLAACGVGDGAVLLLWDGSQPAVAAAAPGVRRCPVIGVLSAAAGVGTAEEGAAGVGTAGVEGAGMGAAGVGGAGMGRTTVSALLGGALAATLGGLTVVMDAHPSLGSLSERLAPDHEVTAGDLLALIDHPALTGEELITCLAAIDPGLALLTSSRGRAPPLGQRDWVRLVRGLAGHVSTLVLDCGPGLGDPGARAALATADQIVLVAEPNPSPANRWMARTLIDQGLPVVLVPARAPPRLDAAALAARLPGVRGVVPLARDPAGKVKIVSAQDRTGTRIPRRSRLWAWGAGRRPPTGLQGVRRRSGMGAPGSWDEPASRLAQVLVTDWAALGIGPSSGS